MKLNELKEILFIPDELITINKTVSLKNIPFHFLGITKSKNKHILWTLHKIIPDTNQIESLIDKNQRHTFKDTRQRHLLKDKYEPRTNREIIIHSLNNDYHSFPMNFSHISIQNQPFTITRSSSGSINLHDLAGMMQLEYFATQNILPDFFDSTDSSHLYLSAYTQIEDEAIPSISYDKPINISLRSQHKILTYPLQDAFTLDFNTQTPIKPRTFVHPETKKIYTYYLKSLEVFDVWANMIENLKKENFQALPHDQKELFEKHMRSGIQKICPEGMKLAILSYETEKDISLSFYSSEHLNETEKISTSDGASAIGLIFSSNPDSKGLPLKTCMIKAIHEDNLTPIDIELVSFHQNFPDETFEV